MLNIYGAPYNLYRRNIDRMRIEITIGVRPCEYNQIVSILAALNLFTILILQTVNISWRAKPDISAIEVDASVRARGAIKTNIHASNEF